MPSIKDKVKAAAKMHCHRMNTDPAYKVWFIREMALTQIENYMRCNGGDEESIKQFTERHREETAEYVNRMRNET